MPQPPVDSPKSGKAPHTSSSRNTRRNRFEKYRLVIAFLSAVTVIVVLELVCYLVIVAYGHQAQRSTYRYNRIISGYTVFNNVPGFNVGSSTLRELPGDPEVVLAEFGFLSDAPILREKPPNLVRIFIMGGSAAFGAGQQSGYHGVHFYPDGVHSYPRSISGQLKVFLTQHDADVKYEIINAAANLRQFHQSTLLYLQTVSTLSPDYVVNIEGWNDVKSMISGTPYDDAEQLLPALIDLKTRSESWWNQSNTLYVFSTAYDKYLVWRNRWRTVTVPNTPVRSLSKEEYDLRKPAYLTATRRFEQLLQHHIAILQTDGTRLVFMLQPMLPRSGSNKELSEIEQKFLAHALAADDDNSLYIKQFFLNDHFVGRCRDLIEGAGEIFIDCNAEIASVDAGVEFYTDYCHLTATGNRIVAEIIGRRILADRDRRKTP